MPMTQQNAALLVGIVGIGTVLCAAMFPTRKWRLTNAAMALACITGLTVVPMKPLEPAAAQTQKSIPVFTTEEEAAVRFVAAHYLANRPPRSVQYARSE